MTNRIDGSYLMLCRRFGEIGILAFLGGALILAGLTQPWVSYTLYAEGGYVLRCYLSPFNLSSIATRPHMNEPIIASYWFYGFDAASLGVGIIVAGLMSFLGGATLRWSILLAGGLLGLGSTVLFPSILPGYLHLMEFEWGGMISMLGSILAMSMGIAACPKK